MKAVVQDDKFRISHELWPKIEPLLPPRKQHPWGCHNPRVPDRKAMDAILFVLRTGCSWNSLNPTGICSSSSAHRRFQEWTAAGVFLELWKDPLQELSLSQISSLRPTGGPPVTDIPSRGPEDRDLIQA